MRGPRVNLEVSSSPADENQWKMNHFQHSIHKIETLQVFSFSLLLPVPFKALWNVETITKGFYIFLQADHLKKHAGLLMIGIRRLILQVRFAQFHTILPILVQFHTVLPILPNINEF